MRTLVSLAAALAVALLAACSDAPEEGIAVAAITGPAVAGKHLFDHALPGTNGRACATCHVEEEHTTLLPASVAARLAVDPADPLFNRLDADDPSAPAPSYAHLHAGLVRVTLPLPDNVDLIDARGHVVTGPDRSIAVWRAVPTVENTAMTAPYQLDGRDATLPAQALGALHAHSQIAKDPPDALLDLIADYERTVFSSPLAAAIAGAVSGGPPVDTPEPTWPPGSPEAAGKALFQQACAPCHGGLTETTILDPAVTEVLHPALSPDGSVTLTSLPDGSAFPAKLRTDQHDNRFLNIGVALGTYRGQTGSFPNLTGVDFPRYRLRFYRDAARKQKLVDLPPAVVDPATGQPLADPPAGPNLAPQAFTVDPGRALITGDPVDFEAFDVPQLRGIKDTAPYFHDDSAPDLSTVIDIYSRFILPQLPSLHLPRVVPPAFPGLPPEALTPEQKAQLLAFLNQL
jgi:cytochrome c peroxidase